MAVWLKFEEVEHWRKAWNKESWRARTEQVPKRCLIDSFLASQNGQGSFF